MKDNEKKVKAAEEVKKEAQPEEAGTPLTEEELAQVTGGGKPTHVNVSVIIADGAM